ncbi:LolA family protein [Actinokineospora enzanensis]|uniref:LolA family protein n=1 Tax=Actinokineospora enzanensis TaxID=155975 RepID=UPI0003A40125|nr:sigma-E factor regulatory protein RseB domain-containing protein [Actinokineospora enzanensis]
MNRKKTALSVAAGGTAIGVVGLILIATPAGADETPPALPAISAEALVQSVLTTDVPALSGAVELRNNIGLPIPGLPQSSPGEAIAHVYADGSGRGRLAVQERGGEHTVVRDGQTTWLWSSADRTVVKYTGSVDHADKADAADKMADPATAARDLVGLMQRDSTISVDGTAKVADRPVYQLVLTPKPTERTLLREIRVSVDSETRLPLRLDVMANGQADPALRVGFTEFSTGPQNPSLFSFTPPAGAKITEFGDQDKPTEAQRNQFIDGLDAKVVGEGWDTVLTGKIPADLVKNSGTPQREGKAGKADVNPLGMLKQLGKEVSGPFGTGYVISTKVGTALVTTDGRVAIGAVPQQVLVDALGQK